MNESMLIACLVAAFCAAVFTSLIRRLAPRLGLMDAPDGHRKLQAKPVPLGGGLAVFLAMATVVAGATLVPNPWNLKLYEDWLDVIAYAITCSGIVALGLIDDRFGLRGRYKLLGQMLCVAVLMLCGMVIHKVSLFGWPIELGVLSIPFTMCWMLAAINAINLLDGIDGLATTLGIILSMTMGILATIGNHPAVGAIAFVFAASLFGFLPFNLPRARIYLGDAGSMLIGLILGALAIRASLKGAGTVLLAAPMAILAIPAFDSAAAILRRKLTGRSIYSTDRGHLHHRLLETLGSNVRVLMCVGTACLVTSSAALLSVYANSDLIALASIAGVVAVFVAAGLFGRAEFLLVMSRLRSLGLSLLHPTKGAPRVRQSQVRLQGTRQWDLLWATLNESTEKLSLARVRLDLNLPAMREGYNALWESGKSQELDECWCVELPLVVSHQTIGRLTVHGRRNAHPAHHDIAQLLDMLEPFEKTLFDIARTDELPLQPASTVTS